MEEVREAVVDSVSYSEPRAESAPMSLAASSVEISAVEGGSEEASWAARGAEVAVVSATVGVVSAGSAGSAGSTGSTGGAGLGELMACGLPE